MLYHKDTYGIGGSEIKLRLYSFLSVHSGGITYPHTKGASVAMTDYAAPIHKSPLAFLESRWRSKRTLNSCRPHGLRLELGGILTVSSSISTPESRLEDFFEILLKCDKALENLLNFDVPLALDFLDSSAADGCPSRSLSLAPAATSRSWHPMWPASCLL